MMRRGFTTIELLVTVAIMALLATLILPMAMQGDASRTEATARLLASDLEHAQILALTRPDVRVALRIDDDGGGWAIVDADHPDTALTDAFDANHSGRTLRIRCGEGRAAVTGEATLSPSSTMVIFTSLGGLEAQVPTMQATIGEYRTSLMVDADTGFATLIK
jgi:prepilin-type N-terminal cleavage/methylation domain-containing protein